MKSTKRIKTIFGTFLILLWVGYAEAQSAVSWDNFKKLYTEYLKTPSSNNEEKVCAAIADCVNAPLDRSSSAYVESKGTEAREDAEHYVVTHLKTLEKRIAQGDRGSIRIAYRLLAGADGEFAEDLTGILNLSSIHRNAELFLEEVVDNREWIDKRGGLKGLLTFMGPAFTDEKGQPEKEYQVRIKELKKVRNPALAKIRDECIEILSSEINNL